MHASFGDLELAKITLREAVVNGLDWDSAVMRSDWVPFTASTQVKIQLRAFAENVQRQLQQQQRQAMSSYVDYLIIDSFRMPVYSHTLVTDTCARMPQKNDTIKTQGRVCRVRLDPCDPQLSFQPRRIR